MRKGLGKIVVALLVSAMLFAAMSCTGDKKDTIEDKLARMKNPAERKYDFPVISQSNIKNATLEIINQQEDHYVKIFIDAIDEELDYLTGVNLKDGGRVTVTIYCSPTGYYRPVIDEEKRNCRFIHYDEGEISSRIKEKIIRIFKTRGFTNLLIDELNRGLPSIYSGRHYSTGLGFFGQARTDSTYWQGKFVEYSVTLIM